MVDDKQGRDLPAVLRAYSVFDPVSEDVGGDEVEMAALEALEIEPWSRVRPFGEKETSDRHEDLGSDNAYQAYVPVGEPLPYRSGTEQSSLGLAPPPEPTRSPSLSSTRRRAGTTAASVKLRDMLNVASVDEDAELLQGAKDAARRNPRFAWNAAYMYALTLPDETPGKSRLLSRLYTNFRSACKRYANVIVSELGLPPEQCTIPPASSLGGVQGGSKFLVSGILFKIPSDSQLGRRYLFSGSSQPSWELAAKAAGHDLKGANAMYSAATTVDGVDLRVPLQVIIDVKGFRVLAMPLLPLGEHSLKYGSSDAGVTVHMNDESINESMRLVAEHLHIAPHLVGWGDEAKTVFSAGDVEAHRGEDGLAYTVDFGRVFPPEAPDAASHLPHTSAVSVMFRMLRPELLLRWRDEMHGQPLNPDGFTGWCRPDPNSPAHLEELRQASRFLLEQVVPEFAARLQRVVLQGTHEVLEWLSSGRLIAQAHRAGINARHLGLVRSHVEETSPANTVLLVECVKRTLKNLLRQQLRHLALEDSGGDFASASSMSEARDAHVLRTAVAFVRLVAGSDASSQLFYSQIVREGVVKRFGNVAIAGVDVLPHALAPYLLHIVHYVLAASSLRLSSEYAATLRQNNTSPSEALRRTPPASVDVEVGRARVKDMQVLAAAEGRMLVGEAAELLDKQGDLEVQSLVRLMDLSLKRLSSAVSSGSARLLGEQDEQHLQRVCVLLGSHPDLHERLLEWLEQPALRANDAVVEASLQALAQCWARVREHGGPQAAFGGPSSLSIAADVLDLVRDRDTPATRFVVEQLRMALPAQLEALEPLEVSLARKAPVRIEVMLNSGKATVDGVNIRNTSRCTFGAPHMAVAGGAWYYEVLLETDGNITIGWARDGFNGGASEFVGGDSHSWSFDGWLRCDFHNHHSVHDDVIPSRWKAGDVIGVAASCSEGQNEIMLRFFLNGELLGADLFVPRADPVYPAVTLFDDLQAAQLCMRREEQRFLPDGYVSIAEARGLPPQARGVEPQPDEQHLRQLAMSRAANLRSKKLLEAASTWRLCKVLVPEAAAARMDIHADAVDLVDLIRNAPSLDAARIWLTALTEGDASVPLRGLSIASRGGDAVGVRLWLLLGADLRGMEPSHRPLGAAILGDPHELAHVDWSLWTLGASSADVWRALASAASAVPADTRLELQSVPHTLGLAIALGDVELASSLLDVDLTVPVQCSVEEHSVLPLAGALCSIATLPAPLVIQLPDAVVVGSAATDLAAAVRAHAGLLTLTLPPVGAFVVACEVGDDDIAEQVLGVRADASRLDAADSPCGDAGAMTLAHAIETEPCVLESVDLCNTELGAAGLRRLVTALTCSSVTSLNVSKNTLGDDAAMHLANALRLGWTLRDLDVSSCAMSELGVSRVAEAGLACLSSLSVGNNDLDDASTLPGLVRGSSSLESLRLDHSTGLNLAGLVNTILEAGVLQTLSLRDAGLDDEDVTVLARLIAHSTSLLRLELGGNALEDVSDMADALAENATLQALDVSSVGLTHSAPIAAALASSGSALVELWLSGNAVQDIRALADGVCASTVLQVLDVSEAGITEDVVSMLKSPSLRKLVLARNKLTTAAPASATALPALQELDLSGNELGDAGHLGQMLHALPALEVCNVRDNPLTAVDALVEPVQAHSALRVLLLDPAWAFILAALLGDDERFGPMLGVRSDTRVLHVEQSQPVDLDRLSAVLSGPTCAVQELSLARCGLAGDVAPLAAVLAESQVLQKLCLADNALDSVDAIARALSSNQSLQVLDLHGNSVEDTHALATALRGNVDSSLAKLDMRGNPVGDISTLCDVVRALERRFGLKLEGSAQRIASLYLDEDRCRQVLGVPRVGAAVQLQMRQLTDEHAVAVGRGLCHFPSVASLLLNGNRIGARGAEVLAEGLHHSTSLKYLQLSQNQLGDAGVAAIASSLGFCSSLNNLKLCEVEMGDEGAVAVARGVKDCAGLATLWLWGNRIGDVGARALAEALVHCPGVVDLDVHNNAIGAAGAVLLAGLPLPKLDVSGNTLSEEDKAVVRSSVKDGVELVV